jgi:DNA polymerase-3 subunit delta'
MMAPPWHHGPWQRLSARRERGAMPHALLLAGPAGLGKRAFAERLIRGLLCQAPVEGDACGQCRACALLAAGTHPDRVAVTLEISERTKKPRKEIIVAQIRALSARLAMASQLGGWQVASIDPADAMNPSAANALLKTLEEPTAASVIILVSDAPWRLAPTIRSRCQRIDFRVPAADEALQWLQASGIDDAANALEATAGNPGLAQIWAEQGMLDERGQVRSELAALARREGDVNQVMRRWIGDDKLTQRLWFAAQIVAMDLRARAAGSAEALGSALDAEALAGWFDRANRARDALRGPLRPDLLVLELLMQWR